MKLIISNKNYSSWSLRAWLLLATNDIAFTETRVALFNENSTSGLDEYSAAAKVPVLYDRDAVIWDSLAICEYISEQYLGGRGWPNDPLQRAEARSCSAEMHSSFFELRESMPMNCRASGRKVAMTPALEKDIKRIDSMWSELREKYAGNGPWLFGEFSIADCMFAPVVMRFATYDVRVSPSSKSYMETLRAHPAVVAWMNDAAAETETIKSGEVGL